MDLNSSIQALFGDNLFNHTVLRTPENTRVLLKGTNVVPFVHHELARIKVFCQQVHNGEWLDFNGLTLTDVVNIGIGGSDSGPAMVTEPLACYQDKGIRSSLFSSVNGAHLA